MRFVRAFLIVLFSFASGCQAPLAPTQREQWPVAWSGRQLFETPRARFFAASPAAASEADEVVAQAVNEFMRDTHGVSTRGLILVTDVSDAPPFRTIADFKALSPSATGDNVVMEQSKALSMTGQFGIPEEAMLRATPISVPIGTALRLVGVPPEARDELAWCVVLPTRATCRNAADDIINGLLQRMLTPGQRILAAPWKPLMQVVTADELVDSRPVVVHGQLILAQPGVSADTRRRQLSEYMTRVGRSIDRRMGAREDRLRRAPSASQPAT